MNAITPTIVDITRDNFQAEVIERSSQRLVVVDFWAEWCGPCRVLGPLLEKLTTDPDFSGKFTLAKVDTEAAPEVASAFQIQSIPAVFAVRDGGVVDAFVGALPELEVRRWLKSLLPSRAAELAAEGKALAGSDPKSAEAKYRASLKLEPDSPVVKAGLAHVLLHQGKVDETREILKALEGRGYLEPEAEAVKADLALHEQAATTGGVGASRAAVAASPGDPTAKLKLAEALAGSGPVGYTEALEIALDLVETQRKPLSEEARQVMLNVFQLLPADSELANEYRRKLFAAMY